MLQKQLGVLSEVGSSHQNLTAITCLTQALYKLGVAVTCMHFNVATLQCWLLNSVYARTVHERKDQLPMVI